jgi:hypothetical protein
MTTYRDHLSRTAETRNDILGILSLYNEDDITEYTAPDALTIKGMAERIDRSRAITQRNLKWLTVHGYARLACTRRVGGAHLRGNRSEVYLITSRGKDALKTNCGGRVK